MDRQMTLRRIVQIEQHPMNNKMVYSMRISQQNLFDLTHSETLQVLNILETEIKNCKLMIKDMGGN